jgi:hypothetical protein
MHINFTKQTIVYKALVIVSLVFLVSSCAPAVSQSEYQKIANELTAAKNELESSRAELSKLQSQLLNVYPYAEILDMCLDAFRLLFGEPSKYGYTAGDVVRWVKDIDTKVKAIGDTTLTSLWGSWVSTTNIQEKNKKAVQLLSYLTDRIKSLSGK